MTSILNRDTLLLELGKLFYAYDNETNGLDRANVEGNIWRDIEHILRQLRDIDSDVLLRGPIC